MNSPTETAGIHFSTTQRGMVSEQIVSSQLMLASNGRLSPYAPVADDDGVDFLIKDKLSRAVVELQVKAAFVPRSNAPGTAQFDIRKRTFNEMSGGFILAVMIDPSNGAFWCGWLIPVCELPGISRSARGCYIITPNPSETSKDRYTKWRVRSMEQVVEQLI